jgi:hypothetical protein
MTLRWSASIDPLEPVCIRRLPVPSEELRVWADYLAPAGFREGVGAGLFAGNRYVGGPHSAHRHPGASDG